MKPLKFLTEFVRKPKNTGAIAPSSSALAEVIVDEIELEDADLVLEYGPGSGAFTESILERAREDADFLAIENNDRMVDLFREQHPDVSVANDSIAEAPALLRERGWEPGDVDCIVSGLPWAAFDEELQETLLKTTVDILQPGGWFATFAYIHGLYLPAGRRFREKLESLFERVETSRIVWRNLPPALVYRCQTAAS